eukprot:353017-Chlamydomonas_euryale.AAC.3
MRGSPTVTTSASPNRRGAAAGPSLMGQRGHGARSSSDLLVTTSAAEAVLRQARGMARKQRGARRAAARAPQAANLRVWRFPPHQTPGSTSARPDKSLTRAQPPDDAFDRETALRPPPEGSPIVDSWAARPAAAAAPDRPHAHARLTNKARAPRRPARDRRGRIPRAAGADAGAEAALPNCTPRPDSTALRRATTDTFASTSMPWTERTAVATSTRKDARASRGAVGLLGRRAPGAVCSAD